MMERRSVVKRKSGDEFSHEMKSEDKPNASKRRAGVMETVRSATKKKVEGKMSVALTIPENGSSSKIKPEIMETGMVTRSAARKKAACETLVEATQDQESISETEAGIMETGMVTRSAARKKAACETLVEATQDEESISETEAEIMETDLPEPTNYLDIIPHVPLRVIFKYLPIEDIINTYTVSCRMNEIATERSTWKNRVLKMNDVNKVNEYIRIIQHTPLLKAVYLFFEGRHHGYHDNGYNAIVLAIIDHLQDLHFLQMKRLSSHYITLLVGKFQNLEVIDIGVCVFELPTVIEAFQSCSKLKMLYLNTVSVIRQLTKKAKESLGQSITKLLIKSCPLLVALDFVIFEPFLKIEDTVAILEERKDQLRNLSFGVKTDTHWKAVDVISSCEKLNLDIIIAESLYKIEELRRLESVRVTLVVLKENILDLKFISSAICMPNVEALCLHISNIGPLLIQGDPLRKMLIKFPKLQELKIFGYRSTNIDNELEKIGNLTELKCLKLRSLRFLTHQGFSHLSKCKSLSDLSLSNITITENSLENILKCQHLKRITVDVQLSKQIPDFFKRVCTERNIIYRII